MKPLSFNNNSTYNNLLLLTISHPFQPLLPIAIHVGSSKRSVGVNMVTLSSFFFLDSLELLRSISQQWQQFAKMHNNINLQQLSYASGGGGGRTPSTTTTHSITLWFTASWAPESCLKANVKEITQKFICEAALSWTGPNSPENYFLLCSFQAGF